MVELNKAERCIVASIQLPVFDAHFHVIDRRFPLVPNNGYLPDDFNARDYLARMRGYRLVGGAVVAGSFQGMHQSYLIDALQALGDGFVGVTQLPASVSDARLHELHAAGVRAVRFNVQRGGSEQLQHLDGMARRVHELLGWHVELYIDSRQLGELYDTLRALPAVSIDHLGLSAAGLPLALKLAEQGARIKACGFGRVDFDVKQALRDFYAANPYSLMFGTDLPSTRAPRPYTDGDVLEVVEALDAEGAARVLCENAVDFYRINKQFSS